MREIGARIRVVWLLSNHLFWTTVLGTLSVVFSFFGDVEKVFDFFIKIWAKLLLSAAGMRLQVHHQERLEQFDFCVFMVNHQSAMDIPIAITALKKPIRFLAKKELFSIPGFGLLLRKAGNIRVDRSDIESAIKSIDEAQKRLKEKKSSVIIFPEGTRTKDGNLLPLKRGGFVMAIQMGLPIVPVVVYGAFDALKKYSWKSYSCTVDVAVGEPISVEGLDVEARADLCKHCQDVMGTMLKDLAHGR
ncbi:1-acyl-sn-glycerol-3-phosphate acyltransferase [bacterium]|nr:1-acyl-sn-glycerol-3-phosphate acyltransferase [bacterium]MBL7052731.1 1-acyl-sn-glycerol-3-phosphate acyltransferase [Candidatus Neomarinimicrobiota bacterium]